MYTCTHARHTRMRTYTHARAPVPASGTSGRVLRSTMEGDKHSISHVYRTLLCPHNRSGTLSVCTSHPRTHSLSMLREYTTYYAHTYNTQIHPHTTLWVELWGWSSGERGAECCSISYWVQSVALISRQTHLTISQFHFNWLEWRWH